MIITIGRECGCNADEIGRMLAGKYGIFCYTKVELIQLAKEKGVYEKYPFFFGEMPVDMMISPMAESLEERLRNTPQEALESVLGGEDCVIVGRAAGYAFRNRKDALRIFLCGEKEKRIERMMDKHGFSRRKAVKIVEETDDLRRGYHEYYSGETWGAAHNYDICLDVMRLGKDRVMHIIDTAFKAMEAVGVEPHVKAIRGGTDGAQLSFKGLPCPNIFAGGLNFHGRYEFVPIQNMEKAMNVIVKIAELVAAQYNS